MDENYGYGQMEDIGQANLYRGSTGNVKALGVLVYARSYDDNMWTPYDHPGTFKNVLLWSPLNPALVKGEKGIFESIQNEMIGDFSSS